MDGWRGAPGIKAHSHLHLHRQVAPLPYYPALSLVLSNRYSYRALYLPFHRQTRTTALLPLPTNDLSTLIADYDIRFPVVLCVRFLGSVSLVFTRPWFAALARRWT